MSIFVERPYNKEPLTFKLIDIFDERALFVTRPPYQRKNVWSRVKKQMLIDSFFRRYYVPNIVLREVHTPDHKMRYEVVDGQQRIIAIQEFFDNRFRLPMSLTTITNEAGNYYRDLSPEVQRHINMQPLNYTFITGLSNPHNKAYQRIVAEIFWRLQQGENLTNIEVEHSKLYSAARNFITKYADDLSFDYDNYASKDTNPSRHKFFTRLSLGNKRLQHLALLARFLMFEFAQGPTDIGLTYLSKFIDAWNDKDLIDFEKTDAAKQCLKTLDVLCDIFKDDPSVRTGSVVPELTREYVILSVYLLARRLVHGNWIFKPEHYAKFRSFIETTYQRWQTREDTDADMLFFRDQRQQNKRAVETRDQLITKWFFEANPDLDQMDTQRNFTYLQRVMIYRKNKGICQECKKEGLSDEEATVPWNEFDADHLKTYGKGGKTTIANGQVLCRRHNRSLGSKNTN